MISRRYYQFLRSFVTINIAFSSPQVFQGQGNELHLAYNPPFESFDAAASLKDPTNAIPMATLDQSMVQADYPSSSTWNTDVMAVSGAHGAEDENLATASNSATDSIGTPSSFENLTTSDSVTMTNPSQNPASSETSYLSTDDQSSLPALAPSLPSTSTKLSFQLDGVDELPFPIPLIKFFPIRLPEFHDDGTRQWVPEQNPPTCEGDFYLYCCEKGPPINGVGRASPRTKDHTDLPKRRRSCKRYNRHFAQCYFPEDVFCCFCRDGFQVAYECYNPYWKNDPSFQNQPIREPRQLPNPRKNPPPAAVPAPDDSPIDPNPEEPLNPQNQQRQRRGQQRRRDTSSFLDSSSAAAAAGDQTQLYAEKKPRPKRLEGICTNEYLRGIGVTPRTHMTDR